MAAHAASKVIIVALISGACGAGGAVVRWRASLAFCPCVLMTCSGEASLQPLRVSLQSHHLQKKRLNKLTRVLKR